jgi:hypothetical protein
VKLGPSEWERFAERCQALPHIELEDGMKSYVKMYDLSGAAIDPRTYGADSVVELVSEVFESEGEAEHFSKALEKHCCAAVQVKRTYTQGEYIVFAKAHVFSVSANYRKKDGFYKFANWA